MTAEWECRCCCDVLYCTCCFEVLVGWLVVMEGEDVKKDCNSLYNIATIHTQYCTSLCCTQQWRLWPKMTILRVLCCGCILFEKKNATHGGWLNDCLNLLGPFGATTTS